MTRVILGFVLISSMSVASGQTPYPSAWPSARVGTSSACLSLSGKYQYRGDVDRSDRGGAATIDRAAFNRMSLRGSPESATLEHDPAQGILNIRIHGSNLSPSDRVQFSRTLKCENGWSVDFRETKNAGNASEYINYAWTRIRYTRAEDNSLIVHFTSEVEGRQSLGNPTKQAVDAWYRFAEIAN